MMKLKEFEVKYIAEKKLSKISLLAANLSFLQTQPCPLQKSYYDDTIKIFKEYLEFEEKPEISITTHMMRIYCSYIRTHFQVFSQEELSILLKEMDSFLLLIDRSIIQAEFYATMLFVYLDVNDFEQAVFYGKKADQLIGNQHLTGSLEPFYSNYGLALIYCGKYELAKQVLSKGLVQNRNQNKFISEKLHLHLGLLYRNQQNYTQALSEFLTALDFHSKDDISGEIIINVDIASIYALNGEYQKVLTQLEDNFQLAESQDIDNSAKTNFIQSFNMYIGCALSLQKFDKSQEGLELMEIYLHKFKMDMQMEDYFRLAADDACARGDHARARRFFEKACDQANASNPVSSFFLLSYINFLLFTSDFTKALEISEISLERQDENDITATLINTWQFKIQALKGLHRYEEAFLTLENLTQKQNEIANRDLKTQIDHLVKKNKKQQQLLQEKEKRISLFSENFVREHNINFIGTSKAIKEVIDKARIAAQHTDINVLIYGESGTGKELIAKFIHYSSQVDQTVFQEVNCSAIPETMLESEFFGYKKGAFTGAISDRKGFIAAANQGTLFLDEIGDLPWNLQPKLLKVLEEKTFTPLGSNKAQKVTFRLVSATNRSLNKLTEENKFRYDLLNRINALVIEIPPLRKRKADIIPLTEHFLKNFTSEFNMLKPEIDDRTREILFSYHYPGNVRELRNIIERTMIFVRQGESFYEALKKHGFVFGSTSQQTENVNPEHLFYSDTLNLADVEKNLILAALKETGNRKNKAAVLLGITASSFTRRLKKYGIDSL